MTCTKCGFDNQPESLFCPACGISLRDTPVPSTLDARRANYRVRDFAGRISAFTSTEPLQGFSLGDLFSEVFRSRRSEEIEEYLLVGTSRTTPALADISVGWPKPWFFMRVFAFIAIVYALFLVSMPLFSNPRFIPGFVMMGSLAVPLAVLVLFFELNTPCNVSFYSIIMLVFFGGIVSLITTSIANKISIFQWMGDPQAGIIEEIAKLAAVVLVCRQIKHKYILNGLLFGAAVGAGFAAFESAGYAQDAMLGGLAQMQFNWNSFFSAGGAGFLHSSIFSRAWLSPFGHVVWTAIAAGALWRVKGANSFEFRMLDQGFWKTFLVPVVCHMTWDSAIAMGNPDPGILNYSITLLLGVVSWYVAFSLVQQGLKQVRDEQIRSLAHEELAMANSGAALVTPAH